MISKSKKIILSFIFILLCGICFGKDNNPTVVASTTWTGAFADLGGIDQVTVIAPGTLIHPPEYEITVSDVMAVSKSDYFIYAGFERMMKTLGNSVGSTKMIKIQCDNSIDTVIKNAEIISKIAGTEQESKKRVKEYINCIEYGRKLVNEKGLKGAKVLCHKHQTFLANELGLTVAGVFGPGPVTSKDILNAKKGNYDIIIDNIHNPVGKPLVEVADDADYIIWRNFPVEAGRGCLADLVKKNINLLFDFH